MAPPIGQPYELLVQEPDPGFLVVLDREPHPMDPSGDRRIRGRHMKHEKRTERTPRATEENFDKWLRENVIGEKLIDIDRADVGLVLAFENGSGLLINRPYKVTSMKRKKAPEAAT